MSGNRRDKRREKYSRNTEGWNAQGFFGDTASNYPADVTLQNFIYATDNAGEIGLYEDDGILKTTILLEGQKFIVAQKNSDDTIKRSTELAFGGFNVSKTLYDAPVKQKDLVFPLNISIVGGLQEFVLSARETTPANQPFPIQEGRAIVRSGNPTDYDIAQKIVGDMNNSYDFERNGDNSFVATNVVTNAAGVVATLGTTFVFTNGSNQIFVAGADVTAEALPGGYIINKEVVTGSTFLVFKIKKVIYDGVNSTIITEAPYAGAGAGIETTITADIFYEVEANMATADIGITLLGVDELTHFDTNVSEDLGDAEVNTITDWNFGSGAAWQVANIEDECQVFDGYTTLNEAWTRDFGAPDTWVDDISGDQYNLYFFESINRIIPSAGAPQNQTLMQSNLVIAAVVGSSLESNLDTILGL